MVCAFNRGFSIRRILLLIKILTKKLYFNSYLMKSLSLPQNLKCLEKTKSFKLQMGIIPRNVFAKNVEYELLNPQIIRRFLCGVFS